MKNSMVMTHKEVATEVDAEVGAVAQMEKLSPDRSVFGSREPLFEKKGSPIPVALVHPLPCSPTGRIRIDFVSGIQFASFCAPPKNENGQMEGA